MSIPHYKIGDIVYMDNSSATYWFEVEESESMGSVYGQIIKVERTIVDNIRVGLYSYFGTGGVIVKDPREDPVNELLRELTKLESCLSKET